MNKTPNRNNRIADTALDDPVTQAMIVEDKSAWRVDAEKQLNQWGITTVTEVSSAEAVKRIGAIKPIILFMDYEFDGDATGVQALAQIQQSLQDLDSYVVLWTEFID